MDKNMTLQLTHLVDLQDLDTCMDEIFKLRGTLPEEVVILEKEIEKFSADISRHENLLVTLRGDIASKKAFIKSIEAKIQQYEVQKMEVRNDREYDAIIKELELCQLDVQLSEKFLRSAYENIDQSNVALETLNQRLSLRTEALLAKKKELETILQASEKEEAELRKQRVAMVEAISVSLYRSYEKIRNSVPNHLAVVPIKKGVCGGCCIVIPPQQKLEVYERNKVVCCEHCGRMLVVSEQVTGSLNEVAS